MLSGRRAMIWINLVGGTAVLGSYAYCLGAYPELRSDFWGGVPEGLRSVYTINMVLAAAGYFAFSHFLMFRREGASETRREGEIGFFNVLYTLILIPSALWMPLTLVMLQSPGDALWWSIRGVLAVVGIGSLGLLAGLLALRPGRPSLSYRLAVAGSLAFLLQTGVLDALVWPAYFPVQ